MRQKLNKFDWMTLVIKNIYILVYVYECRKMYIIFFYVRCKYKDVDGCRRKVKEHGKNCKNFRILFDLE